MVFLARDHEPHHSNPNAGLEADRWICAGTQPPVELKITNEGVEGRIHPAGSDVHDRLMRTGLVVSVELDPLLGHADGVTPKHVEQYAGQLAQAAFASMGGPLDLLRVQR